VDEIIIDNANPECSACHTSKGFVIESIRSYVIHNRAYAVVILKAAF